MVKPTRFTQEMFDEYLSKGLWTMDTTSDLWERNAQAHPNEEAFVDSRQRLTWSQLKRASDSFATSLLELGLKRDELVFMLLPNSVQSFVMRAGFEKAGIIYGTALMTIRESEMEYILKTFDAVGVAIPLAFRRFNYFEALSQMRPNLPKLRHVFVAGDTIPPCTLSIERIISQNLDRSYPPYLFEDTKIKATEVCGVGFTSGTTGVPKGAEHVQCARMAMARGTGELARVSGKDIILNIISAVAGLSSVVCYNLAALEGAKVVLSEIWSPQETLRLIEKEKATVLLAVPAQLAQILKAPNLGDYDISSLRCIYTSTAPLVYALARDLEEALKVPVLNGYGQFDGGQVSGVSIDDPPEVRYSTVGKPHRHNIVRLVGDDEQDVPLGEVGEVVYAGPSATSGYYRDSEATLKTWGAFGMAGRCRSGDLARFDKDGNLILAGRKKDMIIRGGQNIYPSEIEGLLLTHPKIKSAAIVPMPDEIMGEKACAYVALNDGEQMTFEEMISFLKGKKIAPYKLPERLEVREELPLRGEQKVAKASLREDITRKLKAEGKL